MIGSKKKLTFSILFACIGNSCRSQIAEGWAHEIAKNYPDLSIEIQSAGTEPKDQINPLAIQVMKEIGIDITNQKPKKITTTLLKNTTHFISMGCGVQNSCPVSLFTEFQEDWKIADPAGKEIEFFRIIRDLIKNKVEDLFKSLLHGYIRE